MVLALVLSSCNKDLTSLDPSLFTCTPNPLEVKGGKVDATITGTFPVKYFAKNATVTVTPVLTFDGKEVKAAASTFQGEKVVATIRLLAIKQVVLTQSKLLLSMCLKWLNLNFG